MDHQHADFRTQNIDKQNMSDVSAKAFLLTWLVRMRIPSGLN